MGSTSDLPVMEKACQFFEEMEIPFEVNALSAHRTPAEVSADASYAGWVVGAALSCKPLA